MHASKRPSNIRFLKSQEEFCTVELEYEPYSWIRLTLDIPILNSPVIWKESEIDIVPSAAGNHSLAQWMASSSVAT